MYDTNGSVGGYMPEIQQSLEAVDAGRRYHFYFEMPDGTVGYVPATHYEQQYSPTVAQDEPAEQPVGYTVPGYGRGTPYAPPLPRATPSPPAPAPHSDGGGGGGDHYYYYCPQGPYDDSGGGDGGGAHPPEIAPTTPAPHAYVGQDGRVYVITAAPQSMAVAPAPSLPHEAASVSLPLYTPPESFAEMRKWEGSVSWAASVSRACVREPCFCLASCVAPWCVAAAHRRRLLRRDYTQYRCCAGVCGNVDSCECCSECPHCSLFCEMLLCLPCAVHGNRYMLMKRYGLKPACWDSTVSGCGCFCAPLRCCWHSSCCFPEAVCDWLYVVLYACMLTQNHHELDTQEKAAARGSGDAMRQRGEVCCPTCHSLV
ncbi:hypothetical protein NESM_000566300 [Novymonas esmeraldas]|uniref:Uncharacterized protein n=1 Tax=Novymonas esmeraldas TaxID=1808958 RepID=A0AAW0ESS3_9TRYP